MEKKECCKINANPSHEKELTRLNRITGQLDGIKKMIENRRYCIDILIQLKATRSAIKAVENNILKTHLEHCVTESFKGQSDSVEKIEEIKKLFDKYTE